MFIFSAIDVTKPVHLPLKWLVQTNETKKQTKIIKLLLPCLLKSSFLKVKQFKTYRGSLEAMLKTLFNSYFSISTGHFHTVLPHFSRSREGNKFIFPLVVTRVGMDSCFQHTACRHTQRMVEGAGLAQFRGSSSFAEWEKN